MKVRRPEPRTAQQVVTLVATLGLATCGGGAAAPTSPGDGRASELLGLDVSCPVSLLIGEKRPCIAVARLRSGQAPLVSFEAEWSSTPADVVTVDALGLVTGRAAGQAVVSASYRGAVARASVAVTAEDALRITAAAQQGEFRPGTTVTMWLQGYYSVASADSGRLSLRITDQAGTVATTPPLTVERGGDFFSLSSTFVVPERSTELCPAVVLEIAAVTIVEPRSSASGLACVPVRR